MGTKQIFRIRFNVEVECAHAWVNIRFTCALISIHLNNTVANTHLKPVLMQSIKQPDQE